MGIQPHKYYRRLGLSAGSGKREWIVIVPSIELMTSSTRYLKKRKGSIPLTKAAYTQPDFHTADLCQLPGNKRPDVYAAVGPCGAPISNGYVDKAIGPEPQTPFDGIPRAIAMGTYMPIITVSGNLDGFRFPIYDYKNFRTGEPAAKMLLDGINSWARVNRAPRSRLTK